MVAGFAFAVVALSLAWLKGGHPERFGAGVLIIGYMASRFAVEWRIGGFYPGIAAMEFALIAIFGWMALRSNRWWPSAMTAALILIQLVHGLPLLAPNLSGTDIAAAHNGLLWLVYATLVAGVAERWMAGEAPVSPGPGWRRRVKPAS